jgi:holo-[acyl-carrier protein] synthase
MRTLIHGIDIVETRRIEKMLRAHGRRFLDRVFADHEQQYALANRRRAAEHLAARFAAKEAVLKALGTGWRSGIAWTDVQVTRAASGKPGIKLCGKAGRIADSMNIRQWLISLSHTRDYATASVIGMGE